MVKKLQAKQATISNKTSAISNVASNTDLEWYQWSLCHGKTQKAKNVLSEMARIKNKPVLLPHSICSGLQQIQWQQVQYIEVQAANENTNS